MLSPSDYAENPVPLAEAVAKGWIGRPFVYHRAHGFCLVPFGMHACVMAHLFALKAGFEDAVDYARERGIDYDPRQIADRFMEKVEGAAYLSGQSRAKVTAWNRASLNDAELAAFGEVEFQDPASWAR